MTGTGEIRAQALEVATGWSPPDAPASWQLTAALFRLIAGHNDLLTRLADLPPDRLPALLASAAIAFLIRQERPEPLAGYFPDPGRPQPPFNAGFEPAARSFVSEHLDQIAAVCRARRYQMNEVARSAQVALGIAATAASPAEPVALVDLGTGAGLGLQLDQYRYQIGGQAAGPRAAELTLTCDVRGSLTPPPPSVPPIANRAGIEASPVDLRDDDAVGWLQACAPPEAGALTRLVAAIGVTRRNPARIVSGDAVAALPAVLDSLPSGCPVVVVDAYLAVFLPARQRTLLAGILAQASRTRPVTWLSLDPLVPLGPAGDTSVQGLALPASLVSDYQRDGVFAVLGARTFDGTSVRGRLLARAHPSGQWVEWIDRPA